MKRHLNTLFVLTQGTYLSKEGECVAVKADTQNCLKIPLHTIGGIVCFGRVACSPSLMGFCAEKGVAITFLSVHGRFLARVQGPVSGNVLLRRTQYRAADDMEYSAALARSFVIGKIVNCRTVLLRAIRDHAGKCNTEKIKACTDRLKYILRDLSRKQNLNVLRGYEGDAAHAYFSVFDQLIVAQKEAFKFIERNRRPPLDNVNCLLSFLYTLLNHDIRSALETVGLDSAVGFLHRDRPGRPGLALDLMEEFRPFFTDRLALSLINLRKISEGGFKKLESGTVVMDDKTKKIVLASYQKRKQEQIMHPYLKEKITFGLSFQIQALLLARFLRGDLDGYPPFIWK